MQTLFFFGVLGELMKSVGLLASANSFNKHLRLEVIFYRCKLCGLWGNRRKKNSGYGLNVSSHKVRFATER